MATIVGKLYLWVFKHLQRLLLHWGWRDTPIRKMARKLNRVFELLVITTIPNPARVSGLTIYWSPLAFPLLRNFMAGMMEEGTFRVLKKLLRPGGTFIDIGAHIGWYSLYAAKIVGPKGRIYAFEPDPRLFPLLVRNIAENGFTEIIHAEQKGIAHIDGLMKFFLSGAHQAGYSSIYSTGIKDPQCIEIRVITLDSFLASQGWPHIDLIKMDIEGAEVLAFQGMKEVVCRNPRLKMIVEFHHRFSSGAVEYGLSFFKGLQSLGFSQFFALEGFPEPKKLNLPEDIMWLVEQPSQNILCER